MSIKLTDKSEKIIMSCHPAWINELFTWIFAVVFLVVACVSLFALGGVAALICLLIAFVLASNAFIAHYKADYIVTNKRIIVRLGLLSTKQNEVWISDMRGMSLNVSFWQKLLGLGDVMLGTAATAGTEIVIRGIKNPQQVIDVVNKYRKGQAAEATPVPQEAASSGPVVYDSATHQYVRR